MKTTCIECRNVELQLLRHEQTITQLLEIIAATNAKVAELSLKSSQYEKSLHYIPRNPHFSVASTASCAAPIVPHFKE